MWILISFFVVLTLLSCREKAPVGFDLPEQCENSCEVAGSMNELKDAVENSAAGFSNCICLESGVVSGDINIAKSLNIVGKNDGSSGFSGVETGIVIGADNTTLKDISIVSGNQGITVSKADSVILENVKISGVSTKTSVINIGSSSVSLKNINVSNISAGSLYGGRGIVVTGEGSDVRIENLIMDKVDATGLIINGVHNVNITKSSFSNCGFAGIWKQNLMESTESGQLKISESVLENNGAVSIEILGSSRVEIEKTRIEGVNKREISMEVVGDGIVMKSSVLCGDAPVLSIKDVEISGFERAGIILDGENGKELRAATISGLKIRDGSGTYGLIVQNAVEAGTFRSGILENPFTENDKDLSEPLYLLESIEIE